MYDASTEKCEACEINCITHPTKRKRLVIQIDHRPWREVDLFFFQNHQAALEKCSSLKDLETTFDAIEFQQGRLYAVRRITKQALPKKSLVRSLGLRAIAPETIRKIIEDFESRGYLNDREWTRSFVRQQFAKKVGPRAIAQKLAQKGIGKEDIDAALNQECDTGQQEAITALLKTKYRQRNLSDYKERGKVISALMRRGFDLNEIIQACRSKEPELDLYSDP